MTDQRESSAELQRYLADHQVEGLFKEIVVQLCLHTPAEPLAFMHSYLSNRLAQRQASQEVKASLAVSEPVAAPATPQPLARKASRRGGVSAAVEADDDETTTSPGSGARSFHPPMYPKEEREMQQLRAAVQGNVLFAQLSEEELAHVLDAMEPEEHPAGVAIITQGDEGDTFYVVAAGSVQVWVSADGQPAAHVSDIAAGGYFGELALVYGTPRAATIKSAEPVKLWAIKHSIYRRILRRTTQRRRSLYESFLGKVPLLQMLDRFERTAIADALEPCVFAPGSVVIRQGETGEDFYIVQDGTATVTQTNSSGETGIVASLSAGDYFGEVALINHEPRKATVTVDAGAKLVCLRLGRDKFERLLGPCETLLRRHIADYHQYDASATDAAAPTI